jgi:hypothetical protein
VRSGFKSQAHAVLAKRGLAVPMTDLFGVGGPQLLGYLCESDGRPWGAPMAAYGDDLMAAAARRGNRGEQVLTGLFAGIASSPAWASRGVDAPMECQPPCSKMR